MLRYYLTTPEAEKQKARHFGGLFEIGGNAGIRTLDRRIKSPLLYQLSYVPIPDCPHIVVVGRAGLEPTTNGLKVRCSTN